MFSKDTTNQVFIFLSILSSISQASAIHETVNDNYFQLLPSDALLEAETLNERFRLIWNTKYAEVLSAGKNQTRNEKSMLLLFLLQHYNVVDKYELVNMFEKALMIQKKMKYFMSTDSIRTEILKKEVEFRKDFNAKVGKKAKLDFIVDKLRSVYNLTDRYHVYSYFFYDVDWQDTYKSTSFAPARQSFINYYFPNKVLKVLITYEHFTDKLNKIDYDLHGKPYYNEFEKSLMKDLYREFLSSGRV